MSMNVATAVPNNENKIIKHFARFDIEHYAPKISIKNYIGGGVVRERRKFLFPGYIFVCLGDKHREVLDTPGISGVLMSGEKPAKVSKAIIDVFRSQEDEDGFITINIEQRRRFRKGQMVRVKNGPLLGVSGIVANIIGQDNVRVLFNLFGRKTPATVSESELSVA